MSETTKEIVMHIDMAMAVVGKEEDEKEDNLLSFLTPPNWKAEGNPTLFLPMMQVGWEPNVKVYEKGTSRIRSWDGSWTPYLVPMPDEAVLAPEFCYEALEY